MKDLRTTTRFRRDLKRIKKRGYDIDKLEDAIVLLCEGEELPETYKDHALKGEWAGSRDLHVAPDWILIYEADDDDVHLLATGTHSDLFD